VAESETETVAESETVIGFTWSRCSSRTPDSGPRTPDPGFRNGGIFKKFLIVPVPPVA